MIGVVIVTHYHLAEEFLRALQLIVGELDHFRAIGLDPSFTPEDMRARIDKAVHEVDTGAGVLLVVDMFGGTPSNICLSFLDAGRVEVVTGLNLPMIVKIARLRDPMPVHEVAEIARDYGQKNISVASDILSNNSDGGSGS